MTNYGTIPTSSSSSQSQELVGAGPSHYISRAKQRLKEGFGMRKPWKEMFNFRSFSLPSSFRDSMTRIKTNFAYFQMNYVILLLLILFLSLLWHPISLIVFLAMMLAWLFLYFLRDRDHPLSIFGRQIGDIWVIILLSLLTIVFLLLTHVTENVLISLLIAVLLLLVHAIFRNTHDYLIITDEEEEEEAAAAPAFLPSIHS